MKRQANPMKAQNARTTNEWENTGGFSGFPPTWKPNKIGEFIIGVPTEVSSFMYGKGKKAKPIHNVKILLRETNSKSFFTGSKKKKQEKRADVAIGDIVSLPASAKIQGEESLVLIKGKKATLSPLAIRLEKESYSCRIVFNGLVKLGYGQPMKDYLVQIPKGFKEKKGKR